MRTANTVAAMRARLAEVVERKRATMTPEQRARLDASLRELKNPRNVEHCRHCGRTTAKLVEGYTPVRENEGFWCEDLDEARCFCGLRLPQKEETAELPAVW